MAHWLNLTFDRAEQHDARRQQRYGFSVMERIHMERVKSREHGVVALLHWSRTVQHRAMLGWLAYHAYKASKRTEVRRVLGMRRKALLHDGIAQWLQARRTTAQYTSNNMPCRVLGQRRAGDSASWASRRHARHCSCMQAWPGAPCCGSTNHCSGARWSRARPLRPRPLCQHCITLHCLLSTLTPLPAHRRDVHCS